MQKLKNVLNNLKSALRCKLELFKYRRRRAARARKLLPIRWLSHWRLVSDELKLMYEIEPEKIDKNFLEKNLQAHDALKKHNFKLVILQFSIIAFLILSVFDINLPLTAFGFKITPIAGLNEILIIFVSVITAATIGKTISLLTLEATIRTIIPIIHKHEFEYFYLLNSNIDDMPAYYWPRLSPHLTRTIFTNITSSFIVSFLVAKIIVILGASIAWRYFVYLEIWTNSTISAQFAITAVVISIILDLATLVVLLIYIAPMPHRDYSINTKIELATKLSSDAGAKARQEAYGDDWDDEKDMIEKGYIKKE